MEKNNPRPKWIRDLRLDDRFDWIGPPNEISNIRPLRLRHLADESKEEQKYRESREALNEWSSQFWANHNALFERKRAEFVKQKKQKLGRLEHSSAVDMSEFYKDFLDRQYGKLTSFNREWYYRNISLFWPAFKVQMIRFRRSLRNVLRK